MPKKILLVEDIEENRDIYRIIFEHHGHEVFEAADGEAALREARERLPDLILMDISIPGIDGLEVTRRLKTDRVTRDIPVVALTAHAYPRDRVRAESVGCDGYLSKPLEPRELMKEMERFL
jgi:two-component system, cell cycle response regulator DivK